MLSISLAASFVSSSAFAQDALHPQKFERLEGTITMESGGITTRARVQWQAPDGWHVELQPPSNISGPVRTIIAAGEEARSTDAVPENSPQRVRRLPFNLTKAPWRGWSADLGGPANFVLFGTGEKELLNAYKAVPGGPANSKVFKAREDVGRYMVRDWVRTGGAGNEMFYVAYKRPIFDRPAQITLTFDAATKFVTTRRETDERGRLKSESTITYAPGGLPQSVVVRDANNAVTARFTYDLKPREAAFPDGTFALPAPAGQVIEDQELLPIADYQGKDDALAQFNLGVALATHAEDLPAAYAAWGNATRRAPQAVAPPLATFEAALAARDYTRAAQTLDYLEKLRFNAFEIAVRRAGLAMLQRDWDAAQKAFDAAQALQPDNLGVKLTRANLRRTRDDFSGAQTLLLEILATPIVIDTTVTAANALAAITTPNAPEAKVLRDSLPQATINQKLAKALLDLAVTPENKPEDAKNDITADWPNIAIVSLALARERAGQDEGARALWQKLSDSAPQEIALAARRHLMAFHTRRGQASESLKLFNELLQWTTGEKERVDLENAFLRDWDKSGWLGNLKTLLVQRGQSSTAGADDRRLLLIFQQSFGNSDDTASALTAGLLRYSTSAWWNSQLAESKMMAANFTPDGRQKRELQQKLMGEALKAVDAAIAADPAQPYYQVQRSLILTQKFASHKMVIDTHQVEVDRAAAFAALDKLQTAFPGDPDVDMTVALQRLTLTKKEEAQSQPISLLQNAIQAGLPGRDGIDRHATAFPARQMLAIALRQANRPKDAVAQFNIALASARTSSEALGIAVNWLNLLIAQKQPDQTPALMVRLAREPWPFSDAQQLLDNVLNALLRFPQTSQAVVEALKDSDDPHAQIVHVLLREKIAAQLAVLAKVQGTPQQELQADNNSRAAARAWNDALRALEPLVDSPDKAISATVAALLGERSANTGKFEDAAKWLNIAAKNELRDLNLRVAQINALQAAGQIEEAQKARENLPRALPLVYETLKQAALLNYRAKQNTEAARLMTQALNLARTDADIYSNEARTAALLAARFVLAAGDMPRALEMYTTLSAPHRTPFERAAALMDAESQLRRAGKPASDREADRFKDRLNQMGLQADALQSVGAYLQGLEAG